MKSTCLYYRLSNRADPDFATQSLVEALDRAAGVRVPIYDAHRDLSHYASSEGKLAVLEMDEQQSMLRKSGESFLAR